MIDITERPGRNALSIRTRLLQVEWDLDKRLRPRYGYGPHHTHSHTTRIMKVSVASSVSASPTSNTPSPTPSPNSYSPISNSCTSLSSHSISPPSQIASHYSELPPAELDDTWCLILNKVREANSKLLGMDRTFSPLPYSGSKHYSPSVGVP
jgi:hypothetical protein